MKVKILVGLLIFLIVVNLATIGSYIYFRMDDKSDRMIPRFRNSDFPVRFQKPPHLDLDREQMHQLLELRMSFERDTRELSEQIRALREGIFQMLKNDSVAMTDIEGKLDDISRLRTQIDKAAINKLIEAQEYLTPVQRDHFLRFLLKAPPDLDNEPPFRRRPGFLRDREKPNQLNNNNKNKE